MNLKVVVVFGVLSFINGCVAELIDTKTEINGSGVAPPKPSGSAKQVYIFEHNMSDDMLSRVLSAVNLAIGIYEFPEQRVGFVNSMLNLLYPNISFNVVEQFNAYMVNYNVFAVVGGFDLSGTFLVYLIYY